METSPSYGFCPHKRAIAGLDAYYCPDCHRSFERDTPTFKALLCLHEFKARRWRLVAQAWALIAAI